MNVLPIPLDFYQDSHLSGLSDILAHRIELVPFNGVASLIFLCAILHTFVAGRFTHWAHRLDSRHQKKLISLGIPEEESSKDVHFGAAILHFFGEVEAIFGLWCLVLMGAITAFYDWNTVTDYIGKRVNYTEALFVVVIMALASTRPIVKLAEAGLERVAQLGKGSPVAWWLSILSIAPVLGSFITEPAAMTIGALLLGKQFYAYHPSRKLAYATLGLLFVNVSVGGTLTHFAAPPILMVAGSWDWDSWYLFSHFGWKAVIGILVSNGIYFCFLGRNSKRWKDTQKHRCPKILSRMRFQEEKKNPFPCGSQPFIYYSWDGR